MRYLTDNLPKMLRYIISEVIGQLKTVVLKRDKLQTVFQKRQFLSNSILGLRPRNQNICDRTDLNRTWGIVRPK